MPLTWKQFIFTAYSSTMALFKEHCELFNKNFATQDWCFKMFRTFAEYIDETEIHFLENDDFPESIIVITG